MYDIDFANIFDGNARGFHIGNAYCLELASQLAYEKEAKIKQVAKNWGLTANFHQGRDTQAFVAHNADVIIVAFRGTEPTVLADWLTDLDIVLVPGPVGQVHDGFSRALRRVWPDISAEIDRIRQADARDLRLLAKNKKTGRGEKGGQSLWMTGHSLGGAVATLAGAQMTLAQPDRPIRGVYTFGQPRSGDAAFSRAYNAVLQDKTFRFVNNNDVVTRVPPRALGYSHVGSLRYFDVDKNLHDEPEWWDRFLDRVAGRFEDFLDVFRNHDIMPDGIEDHSMADGYIKGLKQNLG